MQRDSGRFEPPEHEHSFNAWLEDDEALTATVLPGSPVAEVLDASVGYAMVRTERLAGAILDQDGHILFANDAFRKLFGDDAPEFDRAAEALSERRPRIAFTTSDDDRPGSAIVYAPVDMVENWSLPLTVREQLRRPGAVTLGLAVAGIGGGDALDDACRAFGLTPLQTRLAAGLVRTGDMRGAAAEAGVSYETARSVIADIFKRVGVARQSSLIERLVSLSFGIAPEGRDGTAALSDVWGLTPRQAALALRLSEGQTRAQAARATGVSEATAKKEIDLAFAALGVRTAAALARVVTETRAAALLTEATHDDVRVGSEFLEPLGLFTRPDGSQVAYSDYGPRSGRPVLVIHSSSASRPAPMALVRTLQAAGFRPLSIDRPGFGLTDPAADRQTHRLDPFDGAVDDMARLCAHLKIPRFDIVARGGAQVAVALARRRPDLMGRVVLVNPDPPTRDQDARGAFSAVKAVFARRPDLIEAVARLIITQLGQGQIDRVLARTFRDSPPDAELMRDPAAIADFARGYRMFLTGRVAGYVDEQTAMTRWTPPSLAGVDHWRILLGAHDTMHDPVDTAAFWSAALPGAAMEIVAEAGRFLVTTHAALVVRTLVKAPPGPAKGT